MYLSIYTYRSTLVYESRGNVTERVLAYSAADIARAGNLPEGKLAEVLRYNGCTASALSLPNGYLGVVVCREERADAERVLARAQQVVLDRDFDECVWEPAAAGAARSR